MDNYKKSRILAKNKQGYRVDYLAREYGVTKAEIRRIIHGGRQKSEEELMERKLRRQAKKELSLGSRPCVVQKVYGLSDSLLATLVRELSD